jgi:MFS family permease
MGPSNREDLKNSIYDGIFANMFATLTGGVFLTGFALYLGMDDFMIGVLASMPFVATLFQLPASYLIGRNGKRKQLAYWAAAGARLTWIPVVLVAFLPWNSASTRSFSILVLIFVSYAFVSVSYVSWLTWMSDLVPDGTRGSFFGTRNMLNGGAGMIVMVVFGFLLDYLKSHLAGGLSIAFSVTFLAGVSFGILSLYFLRRVSEPVGHHGVSALSFRTHLGRPFGEKNFRRFLVFILVWSFSVYFASPFFTVYFLRDLEFSYGFVAALGMLSALADLIGMRLWGRISDKVRNKAVVQFAGWVAVFLPAGWITVRPDSMVMPVLLTLIGGGFWAGINLCSNNLLLKISPQPERPFYISLYNIMGGLGAAAGPLVSGFILKSMTDLDLHVASFHVFPVHVIFLVSTVLRLLGLQLFRYVREPEEVSVGQMVRILRSVRGLNVATGFNYLLHPFIEIAREASGRSREPGRAGDRR